MDTGSRRASALQHTVGHAFPVLCSAAAERRAEQIARRLEQARRHLAEVLAFEPALRLLVLSREDWAENAAFPVYGMPHYADADTIVVGDEPARFLENAAALIEGVLTAGQRAEMRAVYGTHDGQPDMSAFADLLVVHELGHLFHEQVPFRFPRLWLMELFANLCVHAYVAEREPEQLALWTTLPARTPAQPPEPLRHRSLDDFERLYVAVGPENYVWYQFRLATGAAALYEAVGAEGLRRLHHTFATSEKHMTSTQLARVLEQQVHPLAARLMSTWSA